MRISSFIFSVLFIAIVSTTSNANTIGGTPNAGSDYKTEITKTLNKLDLSDKVGEVFNIKFMINSDNELIIVSTSVPDLDETVKAALNYKKVQTGNLVQNQIYTVPVRVKG